jgi:hypothetical protein
MFSGAAKLSWLDLTCSDRDKTRRILDLFSEQGTTDELGLGSLRDAFADALFPGTSTLYTRLRYFLFIPWIYQALERQGGGRDIAERARKAEVELIDHLVASGEEEGVIGIQARDKLSRLPSNAYWAGLVKWGLFRPGKSQGWYHTHFDALVRRRSGAVRADDPGLVLEVEHTWNPHLPPAPAGFPEGADFRLRPEEAEFLLESVNHHCSGSLLAWLASEGRGAPAASLWEDPVAWQAPGEARQTLELARRFSHVMEGAPLFYNLMLAERRHEQEGSADDGERVESYRAEFLGWAEAAAEDLSGFPLDELWAFAATEQVRLVQPMRQFVEQWIGQLASLDGQAALASMELRRLIEHREVSLKKGRARLTNRGRLLDWSGRVGVGRMQFRWPQVRQILTDLRAGLGR